MPYFLVHRLFYLFIKLIGHRFVTSRTGTGFNDILLPRVDMMYAIITLDTWQSVVTQKRYMEELNQQFSDKALRDFKLIDLATEGKDQTAYAELMDRYKNSVYHTILKMVRNVDDAEDLTIEAFAKAFGNLGRFKKDYTFGTWLFRIATNNAIDFMRKKKLNTFSLNSSFTGDSGETVSIDIQDKNLTPDQKAIEYQKIKLVRIFVDKLPAKYQRLIKLRYFEELSYEEIAKKLEVPLGTVKAQLHRSKELMYELVKDKKSHI